MKSLVSSIVFLLAGLVCRAGGVTEMRVLLLPMELTGPASANWLPDALRQNMVQELARSNRLVIVAAKDATATSDPEQARETGIKHRAELVIFGSCQVNNADVRLMGMVLNVKSGKITGVTKLTGSMRDVFGLEDQFAEHCRRLSLEALQDQLPKPDPVAVFAKNLDKPVPAIKPGNPVRAGPWPWEVPNPDVEWARDSIIYGRRTNTDYYSYPLFPMGAAYGSPGYGGLNFGRGWLGYPLNTTTYNGITFSRSYQNATSLTWGATYFFPGGMLRINTGW
ncbi:MAG: hypothetical protein ACHRHE_19505 [Tepidisphaerales bacterium]